MSYRRESFESSFDTKAFVFFLQSSLVLTFLFGVTYLVSETYSQALIAKSDVELQAVNSKVETQLASIFSARKEKEILATTSDDQYTKRTIPRAEIALHIPKTGKFIAADLSSMTLTLFKEGDPVAEYPIVSKGKEGSRWETPSGLYSIETKEGTHYSTIGDVYMPYSMQFYGNFFIHGWPYYSDDSPVPKGFSGGCIRLSTPDSKEVFAFADVNTPVFVFENELTKGVALQNESQLSLLPTPVPTISAKSFLVADLDTGEVFLEKNSDTILPIASLTKLMTAIVSNEAVGFEKKITITQPVLDTHGESGGLALNEKLTATELLYPLLMESSNDAAVALSTALGEKKFIRLMNEKASALSMNDTHYKDTSGIAKENTSTANNLFTLARYMYEKQPFLLNITKLSSRVMEGNAEHKKHVFANFNVFSKLSEFLGGKTGFTNAAKETMISLFRVESASGKRTLAVIVLGSEDRKTDVESLVSWFKFASRSTSDILTRSN